MMKLKFEGLCPHCQKRIELIRELPTEVIAEICSPQAPKKPAKQETKANPPEDSEDRLVTTEDIARLDTEMVRAHWDNMRFGKYANQEKEWKLKSKKDLTLKQLEEAIKDIIADSVK